MKRQIVIYESPTERDHSTIKGYIKKGIPVWTVEPFHAFHHKRGLRFFPPAQPEYIEKLIEEGKIKLLKAGRLRAYEIYPFAAAKAVKAIESVFPEYRKGHNELMQFVSDTLKTDISDYAFKKNLCERLAEFYSLNILIQRLADLSDSVPLLFYPDTNVRLYLYLKKLVQRSEQDYFEHHHIKFSVKKHIGSTFESFKDSAISLLMLSAQTLASGVFGIFKRTDAKLKKNYLYGISIIAPRRQLSGSRRGPDFLIDGNKINADDEVYLPLTSLTKGQEDKLRQLSGSVYYPPQVGRYFSNFTEWRRLLWTALKCPFLRNGEEVRTASNLFFNFFRWACVMRHISFRHFITHSDYGINHIGRNIALNQAGVQTWYFTDSMNNGNNFNKDEGSDTLSHPFRTYMFFDHLITWNKYLAGYYGSHPGAFRKIHVVGCLWSGHIRGREEAESQLKNIELPNVKDAFILTAFDSTYSNNGITSYKEGIAFAEDILHLADDCSDIKIFLKEKKGRAIHNSLDPLLGPRLIDLYNKIDTHARITVCTNEVNSSDLISLSDMVVSFPFTSTTFETLSVNRAAVWHDPSGYYRETPYAKVGGVTTHSYDELKAKVQEVKNNLHEKYNNPIPADSPLIDRYRDGKAIDRFRDLLVSDSGE